MRACRREPPPLSPSRKGRGRRKARPLEQPSALQAAAAPAPTGVGPAAARTLPRHRPARRLVQSGPCRAPPYQPDGAEAPEARRGLVAGVAAEPAEAGGRDGAVGGAAGGGQEIGRAHV